MSKVTTTEGSDNVDYRTVEQGTNLTTTDGYSVVPTTQARPQVGWDEAMEGYLNAALDSDHTRRAYRRHLRDARVILQVGAVDEVSGPDLANYRAAVIASTLAPASQAQALSALRSFLIWVSDTGGRGPSGQVVKVALRTPRGTRSARYTVLTEAEVGAMLDAGSGARELAMLAVLLGGGLRIAEASSLMIADLVEDLDGGMALFVNQGKGRKDRVVPIGPEVDAVIRAYLVSTGRFLGGDGPVFLATDRGVTRRTAQALTTRAMSRQVKEVAVRAGIAAKRVTPHSLRHTYATRCLRAGGSVVAVARLLGHSSIATTQRYVDHLATSELRSTVPKLPL